MKPSNLAKLHKIQNIGVKASKMTEHPKQACIMDPDKVSIVLTGYNIADVLPEDVPSFPEGPINTFDKFVNIANQYDENNTLSVVIPTSYLKVFIDSVTQDWVKLSIRKDAPLVLYSAIEDVEVSMMIAPRIEDVDE